MSLIYASSADLFAYIGKELTVHIWTAIPPYIIYKLLMPGHRPR